MIVKKGDKVIDRGATGVSNISIDEGDNTITVDVLAPNFVATKTYTLTINRASANASDDDRLSSLSPSQGMLIPAFDPADLAASSPDGIDDDTTGTTMALAHAYEVRVANSVESLTVMAEAAGSGAMVNITSASGSSMNERVVDLVVDDGVDTTAENVITIAVTAEDRGAPKHYQVTVTRVAASASSNAALTDLTLSTTAEVNPSLTPAFDTASLPALTDGAHHFTASVARSTDMIQVDPEAADDGANINVMSNADAEVMALADEFLGQYEVDLEVGDNVITVMVTAENVVTTKTYRITINRPGTGNAALSDLSLSGVSLNEAFGTAADDAYTADATESIDSTTVMATAIQSNATVSILPGDADSAMDGHQVALTPGSNTITVTVTAGSNTRVYTVTVTVMGAGTILDIYDTNPENGIIDTAELREAILHFIAGDIDTAQMREVIILYISG